MLKTRNKLGLSLINIDIIIFILLYLAVAIGWCVTPFVNEYREWAELTAAQALAYGGELYPPEAGTGVYLYGILYPLLSAPIVICGASGLPAMRFLSLIITIILAGISVRIVREKTRSNVCALFAFALLLAVNWQNVLGTATPAPLGTLLLVMAIYAAEKKKIFLAALLSVLCFYVKPYFVAVLLPIAVTLFYTSRKQGTWYLLYFITLGLFSAVIVRSIFPYYFVYNVVHHFNAASADVFHLLKQLCLSLLFFWPLMWLVFRSKYGKLRSIFGNVWLTSFVLLFIVWLRLAMHVGAFMTYAFHLWLPPLVIGAFTLEKSFRKTFSRHLLLIMLFSIVLPAWRFLLAPPPDNLQRIAWETLRKDMMQQRGKVAVFSPVCAPLSDDAEAILLDNGQTQYFETLHTDNPVVACLIPEQNIFEESISRYRQGIDNSLRSQAWQCVVIDSYSKLSEDQLRQYGYQLKSQHKVRVGLHDITVSIFLSKLK